MILVDPDLDSDTGPQASASKRVPSTAPAQTDRRFRVPAARTLVRFLREAQTAVGLRGQVSVLLTTDANMRRLNRQFRGKNKATDVLSFPALEGLEGEAAGDLAISVPTARRQAGEQGHALGVEIKVLMLHGLLHLAGYDHERDSGEMAVREQLLRGRLGLPQGLIERVGHPTFATNHPSDEDLSLGTPASREDGARKVRGKRASEKQVLPLRDAQGQDDNPNRGQRRRRKA